MKKSIAIVLSIVFLLTNSCAAITSYNEHEIKIATMLIEERDRIISQIQDITVELSQNTDPEKMVQLETDRSEAEAWLANINAQLALARSDRYIDALSSSKFDKIAQSKSKQDFLKKVLYTALGVAGVITIAYLTYKGVQFFKNMKKDMDSKKDTLSPLVEEKLAKLDQLELQMNQLQNRAGVDLQPLHAQLNQLDQLEASLQRIENKPDVDLGPIEARLVQIEGRPDVDLGPIEARLVQIEGRPDVDLGPIEARLVQIEGRPDVNLGPIEARLRQIGDRPDVNLVPIEASLRRIEARPGVDLGPIEASLRRIEARPGVDLGPITTELRDHIAGEIAITREELTNRIAAIRENLKDELYKTELNDAIQAREAEMKEDHDQETLGLKQNINLLLAVSNQEALEKAKSDNARQTIMQVAVRNFYRHIKKKESGGDFTDPDLTEFVIRINHPENMAKNRINYWSNPSLELRSAYNDRTPTELQARPSKK